MKVIIAGDGETGQHIARILSIENQDIVLIGSDRSRLSELDAVYNFITFEGSPVSVENLMRCGAENADLFVGVTPDETVNIIAAQLAKSCGVRKCVARIDTPELSDGRAAQLIKSYGVDMTIYPEKLAALEIKRFIANNWVSKWFELHGGKLLVIGVYIREGAPICNKLLRDLPNNPRLFHVSAIQRVNDIIIPRGDDMLNPGDTVYFCVLPQDIQNLAGLCGKEQAPVRRIMITGAGRVTENLLEELPARISVTVVDPDIERCRLIASRFPRVVVVNSNSNDVTTLKEEGINNCDMFLALTGSSERNIVSCMVAREHHVPRTLARIEELQYAPEAESLAIDKIINKKQLNAGNILHLLLGMDVSTPQCLSLDKAEIIEMKAAPGSRITSKPVFKLGLPVELTIGGIIRDGKGMMVDGKTQIMPGDHVMVFCLAGSLTKVDRLFR